MEIDEVLSRKALDEAEAQFPEFAGLAAGVVARPLFQGFAWQLEWKSPPPEGQQAWEFQNAAVRAYKKLAGVG